MTTTLTPLQAIGISGSPSPNSRSRLLLDHTLAQLAELGVDTHLLDLSELPADALLARRRDDAVDAAVQKATQAQILILGTPIYRATYTGQLKAFLDLFPQAVLRGRVTGLIATGASPLSLVMRLKRLGPMRTLMKPSPLAPKRRNGHQR